MNIVRIKIRNDKYQEKEGKEKIGEKMKRKEKI
jgi:hypothetical protein